VEHSGLGIIAEQFRVEGRKEKKRKKGKEKKEMQPNDGISFSPSSLSLSLSLFLSSSAAVACICKHSAEPPYRFNTPINNSDRRSAVAAKRKRNDAMAVIAPSSWRSYYYLRINYN